MVRLFLTGEMDFVDFFLKLFFRSGDWFVIVLVVLQMIGLWKMFEKSGIKGWWALIPAAREYQLGRCAGREPEGRMLSVLAACTFPPTYSPICSIRRCSAWRRRR